MSCPATADGEPFHLGTALYTDSQHPNLKEVVFEDKDEAIVILRILTTEHTHVLYEFDACWYIVNRPSNEQGIINLHSGIRIEDCWTSAGDIIDHLIDRQGQVIEQNSKHIDSSQKKIGQIKAMIEDFEARRERATEQGAKLEKIRDRFIKELSKKG